MEFFFQLSIDFLYDGYNKIPKILQFIVVRKTWKERIPCLNHRHTKLSTKETWKPETVQKLGMPNPQITASRR